MSQYFLGTVGRQKIFFYRKSMKIIQNTLKIEGKFSDVPKKKNQSRPQKSRVDRVSGNETIFMPPTSKKLTEHIGFGLCVSPSMCPSVQEPCIYGFLMEIYLTHVFFLVRVISLSGVKPLWKNLNEIWCMPYLMNRACKGFEISYMDSSWKNSWLVFFFLFELSPFLEICPSEKISMKSCQQDISKSVWARGLKLGQLIGDDK